VSGGRVDSEGRPVTLPESKNRRKVLHLLDPFLRLSDRCCFSSSSLFSLSLHLLSPCLLKHPFHPADGCVNQLATATPRPENVWTREQVSGKCTGNSGHLIVPSVSCSPSPYSSYAIRVSSPGVPGLSLGIDWPGAEGNKHRRHCPYEARRRNEIRRRRSRNIQIEITEMHRDTRRGGLY
jgi:hypothetical protein